MRRFFFDFMRKFVRNFMPELARDNYSLRYLLYKRAIESSADFIEENMLNAQVFESREGLYKYVMQHAPQEGQVLEFGVHNGLSINFIAKLTDRSVHGFDSFEGLPDDGQIPDFEGHGVKWHAGKMDLGGHLPPVRDNVTLHKGWFDDTAPAFFKDNKDDIAVLHIDCDIYSSTVTVFENAQPFLKSGSIIIFDEYLNYEGWQKNEHRALIEFAKAYNMTYEFIAYTYFGEAAIRIIDI